MSKSVAFKAKTAATKEVKLPPALASIDKLTERHAAAYGELAAEMIALNAEMEACKKKRLAQIRKLVIAAKATKAALNDAVIANAALFEKPRTRQLHGFKIGMRKLEGRMVFSDEDKAVELVRKHLPDLADVLIKTTESIVKDAAGTLNAADLKRIGGQITDSVDEVVIKPTAGDVEKLVDALIKEKADE
jgi:hypothetical protein